jgi:predicted ATPase
MSGKPIKLGKVAAELNVGLNALVEFLTIQGITKDTPQVNTLIDPEIHQILRNVFLSKDVVQIENKESQVEEEWHGIDNFIIQNPPTEKKEINPKFSFGFENFKRFEKFAKLDFNAINFFVGPNNSGKSTAVKAYRLILNNLNKLGEFFELNGTWDENSNTFSNEEKMRFELTLGDYDVDLTLLNNQKGIGESVKTNFRVEGLSLENTLTKLRIVVLYNQETLLFFMDDNIETFSSEITFDFNEELTKLYLEIEKLGNVRNKEYLTLVDKRNKLIQSLKVLIENKQEVRSKTKVVQAFFDKSRENNSKNSLENLINTVKRNIQFQIHTFNQEIKDSYSIRTESPVDDKRKEDLQIQIQQLNQILEDKRLINFFKDFKERVRAEEIIYLEANLSKQKSLFLVEDLSNQLSQAIHKYADLKEIKTEFNSNDSDFVFLKNWMQEFEILSKEINRIDSIVDFEIIPKNGIAYEFNLLLKEGNRKASLSNMGMGSIQVMTLLLRLATLIRKLKTENKLYLVVVEEPELNLHPNFQSKLCDLFFEVNKEFPNIRFVIETHSEYMIRKSQLWVKEKRYENESDNPFNVVYFDKVKGPYEMKYRLDGKFKNEFGRGFFDESTNLAFDLF